MAEDTLIKVISQQTELIFYNMQISMKTCDRNYLICGVPAWRYVYHTLHSCDKWFVNPNEYTEPSIHVENLDKVDIPCDKVLSDDGVGTALDSVADVLHVVGFSLLEILEHICKRTRRFQ